MDRNLLKSSANDITLAICNGSHQQMVEAFSGLCLLDAVQVLLAAVEHPEVGFPSRIANLLFDRLSQDHEIADNACRELDECEREALTWGRRMVKTESAEDGSCTLVAQFLDAMRQLDNERSAIATIALVITDSKHKRELVKRHIQFCLEHDHEIQI